MDNYFNILNSIDVSEHIETKNGLNYLSWAWAWAELKKHFPDAVIKINHNEQGWNYFTDGRTCWVEAGVVVNGLEYIEPLAIMDYKNKSIAFEDVTSFDVMKSIQRAMTKSIARHGLGLYIYAGEDLPEDCAGTKETPKVSEKPLKKSPLIPEIKAVASEALLCERCGEEIKGVIGKNGQPISTEELVKIGLKNKKNPNKLKLCADCQRSL
jgi:hypothetical protein